MRLGHMEHNVTTLFGVCFLSFFPRFSFVVDRNWCLVDFVCVVELSGVFFGAKVEARVWCCGC